MIFSLVPGAAESPVILHVPHSSRAVKVDGLLLTEADLADELDNLTDAHTDVIAASAATAATMRPWIFENRWSRLVVDPERFLGEEEEMRAVGMGAVYTHGYAGRRLRDDDPVRAEAALREHYRPYARGLSDLVSDRLEATGRAVLLDVHSYASRALPYELHGAGPRPPICLGTDDFHTPPDLVAAAVAAFPAAGFNTPFAGCYVPADRWRTDPRVRSLMIEIRRDTYMTEPGGPHHEGLPALVTALTALIDAV
jgi:N-formylglutamate amidohydrolase